jgi:hypothetical protein
MGCRCEVNYIRGRRHAERSDLHLPGKSGTVGRIGQPTITVRLRNYGLAQRGEAMSFRFRRTVRVLPGLRLNVGQRNISASVGTRGFWYTLGSAGRRITVGLPGTGLYWTKSLQPGAIAPPGVFGPWLPLAAVIAFTALCALYLFA